MDEYIEIANVGFWGDKFLEGLYGGKVYLAIAHGERIVLISRTVVNDNSKSFKFGYKTSVLMDELDDLLQCKMYATYKGNEYEVLDTLPGLKRLDLHARKNEKGTDYLKEDFALGFKDDYEMKIVRKFVTPDEIDSIRVEKRSVKEEFLKKYYSK